MVNIPFEATSKGLWEFFKSCGKIKDIILPRKRDRNGKRFGFIKVANEDEVGLIINNAKEKGGLVNRIAMSINKGTRKIDEGINLNSNKGEDIKSGGKDKVEDCSKKMFEYTEAAIDEEVEAGLFKTLVGITWVKNLLRICKRG